MPGIVVFGRRWGIASDDLVFPGFFELFVRVLWYVVHPPRMSVVLSRMALPTTDGLLISSSGGSAP